jgi:predicted nuclease of predicted toxin-antitoxin system
MHFLIDAQLPPALCSWFVEQGHQASHVADVLGGQTPDREIADYAATNGLVLVTKDDDFVLRHTPDTYRLIWVRCGNITNRALRVWLSERWPALVDRLNEGDRLVEMR